MVLNYSCGRRYNCCNWGQCGGCNAHCGNFDM